MEPDYKAIQSALKLAVSKSFKEMAKDRKQDRNEFIRTCFKCKKKAYVGEMFPRFTVAHIFWYCMDCAKSGSLKRMGRGGI